jgi:tetratricopeptide (TPR) repeat protein
MDLAESEWLAMNEPDTQDLVKHYRDAVMQFKAKGDLESAEASSLKILHDPDTPLWFHSSVARELSKISRKKGDLTRAAKWGEWALTRDRAFAHLSGIAQDCALLAGVYLLMNKTVEAEASAMEAINTAQDPASIAIACAHMGLVCARRRQIKQSQAWLYESLENANRCKRVDLQAATYANLAVIKAAQGLLSDARLFLERADALFKQQNMTEELQKVRVLAAFLAVANSPGM